MERGMTFRRLKTITSHAGHARWLAECDLTDDGDLIVQGYLATVQREEIPSPYAYSPTTQLYRWNGKKVFLSETRHRRYEVFEVPANMLTFKTDEEATAWHIRFSPRRAAR
jgi:hypothetical protein